MDMRVITNDEEKNYTRIDSCSFKTSDGNEIAYEIYVADVEAIYTYKPADPEVPPNKTPFEAKEYKITAKDSNKILISILMAEDLLVSQFCQNDICAFLSEGMKKLLEDYFKNCSKLGNPL